MPTKFVPLELQLAKQSSEGKKVLSMTELEIINRKNDNFSVTIERRTSMRYAGSTMTYSRRSSSSK
jgi:hypothetical protein